MKYQYHRPASEAAVSLVGDACLRTGDQTSILVGITNYGRENDDHLRRMLAEFRSMQFRLKLHVFTNLPKNWGADVTVHVGLPTRDPRSLAFAHRRFFAERVANYDYFLYCEDDVLITERNIKAFQEVNRVFKPDEIPGFLRLERPSDQECYMESAHGSFRWDPNSLTRRGSWTFASFTNVHSALAMASQAQLQQALNSGGFLVRPHLGRYGMLESAACDLYTQCGLKRLICLPRIDDFLVPHLSNKNNSKWGLRYEEFRQQTTALERIAQNGGWQGSLFEVETRVPRGRWSKGVYELPDPSVLGLIPDDAKTVLSVGCGWGETEQFLANRGRQVTAVPIDAVFGDCLRRRGIEVVEGTIERVVGKLRPRQFDMVLLQEVLHLLPDPARWLSLLQPFISRSGLLVTSVPRTFDPLRLLWLFRGEPDALFPRPFPKSHVQRVTYSRLKKLFNSVGMDSDIHAICHTPVRGHLKRQFRGFGQRLLADRFIALAKPRPGRSG